MRVLVVSEASGGHINPALSFLDNLKDRHKNIASLLVLPSRSLKFNILHSFCKREYISISPIELRFSLKNILSLFKFLKGSLEGLILLLKFRPDVVVGFGGITSVPLILLAWLTRTKTLIHEQNVIPGKANSLLAKFSDKIAVSFPQTQRYLGVNKTKIKLTGNPLRKELKRVARCEALSFFGFEDNKFTILVMGGSYGSHNINLCFLGAISTLPDASQLQIIHISGENDYCLLEERYRGLQLNLKLYSFLKDIQYGYSICDLVISRAGATTIAELIKFRLPAVIIPYPFANRHQLSNAKVLERKSCAIIINDNDLNAASLRKTIEPLIGSGSQDKLKNMRLGYEDLSVDFTTASESLVNAVMSL